jgi:small subunit ribosomal protein S1
MTQKSKTNVEEKDELIENQVVENDDRAEKEPVEENAKTDDEAQEQETEPESFVKKEETATDGGDESAKKTGKEIIPDDDKKEKPKAKKSTEKPAKGKAAEETVTEKVAEEKAAEETVTEKVAEEKAAEETVSEKVAEEKAAEETVTEKVAEEKAAEETVTEKVAEEKAAEETVIEKTTAKTTKKTTKKTGKKEEKTAEGFESPDANFDWDALNKSTDIYDADQRQEYEKMYGDTLSTVAENEVVEGTVIAMNKREVVINVGYKSEGVVSLNEFRYNPDLKIGEQVEVYVESQEDKKGQLLLSHKKARALKSWDRVNEALEKDEIIKGYIKCRTKGGMIVDVFGIEAFLPGSQIDVKPIRDYDVYVGKTMEFKVVKINHEFKNVVVSHKALIEAELEQQKKEIIAKLEKGQILEGTVKNITSYGVFIDLGGVDGLIHITDLSWGRVNHPEEIVQLDQKLQVVILDFDDEKKRIALGLKQLSPHPWDSLDSNLSVGNKVKGKVVVMADYGAFVEIAPGVEGLIHVSEMSWSQHLRSAQEFLRVGDEVEAVILTLDRDERKMSLGMKQLKPDPWENIEEKYAVGSKHTAKVRNFTNFGVFVEIEEGVDGLIHISDLSWTKKIKHPAEFTNIGDEIEVVVLEIDKENRRLSLGHKQLEENPWDVFETIFTVDSIHEGTIIEISDKGAVVALQYGVEGFVTPKHLVKEDGSTARIDEKLNFKVIEFSKSAKKIVLSHSRIYEEDRKAYADTGKKAGTAAARKTPKKVKSSIEKTTLGDITDLAALKDQLERNEKQANQKKKEKKEKSDDKES